MAALNEEQWEVSSLSHLGTHVHSSTVHWQQTQFYTCADKRNNLELVTTIITPEINMADQYFWFL